MRSKPHPEEINMTSPIHLEQKVDFIAKTAAGVVIQTFGPDCSDLALSFVRNRENQARWPGLYLDTVRVVTTTKRLWTDRAGMARAA